MSPALPMVATKLALWLGCRCSWSAQCPLLSYGGPQRADVSEGALRGNRAIRLHRPMQKILSNAMAASATIRFHSVWTSAHPAILLRRIDSGRLSLSSGWAHLLLRCSQQVVVTASLDRVTSALLHGSALPLPC